MRLAMAEWHYAQGMPPHPLDDATFGHLERARALYPLMQRFRDGPAVRFKLFEEQGR